MDKIRKMILQKTLIKKQAELGKPIQNMNGTFSKETESMKMYQTKIWEINYFECVSGRSE